MDSETFSVRNQGVGCALAWVTIARDSESDYPFILWCNSAGFVQDTYGVKLAQLQQICATISAVVVTVQV